MQLITVSTATSGCSSEETQFVQQSMALGYVPTILGKGVKWEGFVTLMKLFAQHLQTCNPDELVALVDCFDLLPLATPAELEHKFLCLQAQNPKTKIVMGCENIICGYNCHSQREACPHCPDSQAGWNINTGLMMGAARDLLPLLRFMRTHTPQDDQLGAGLYRAQHCDEIVMDVAQDFIANINVAMPWRKMYGFRDHRIYHRANDTFPCFMHFPLQDGDLGARYCHFRSRCARFPFKNPYTIWQWMGRLKNYLLKIYRTQKDLRRKVNLAGSVGGVSVVVLIAIIVLIKLK